MDETKQRAGCIINDKYSYRIRIDATVRESATGTTLQATTVKKKLLKDDVKLTIQTRDLFKPGLTHPIKV